MGTITGGDSALRATTLRRSAAIVSIAILAALGVALAGSQLADLVPAGSAVVVAIRIVTVLVAIGSLIVMRRRRTAPGV